VHKLLFDNNISHRVIAQIQDIFPNTNHVMLENLDESSDYEVWEFAHKNSYTVVTKDSDFNDLVIFRGIPPKVIWIKIGNCRVSQIVHLLKANEKLIKSFMDEPKSAILEL